jgi:hypothetical protein
MKRDPGFFVGYFSKVPAPLAVFSLAVGALLVGAFAALALVVGTKVDDPNPARSTFAPDQTVTGIYQAEPYPMLRAAPDAEHPQGRTVLLSGDGKRGAQEAAKAFAGQAVTISGFGLKRGAMDMVIVDTIGAAKDVLLAEPVAAVPLGRWRLSGEVCDGKCVAGAMKPGTGLAHKGCANLCIVGGLPPLLVTEKPVEGSSFMLLASETGGPLAVGTWENTVARPVILEGALSRVGDLLVFKVDWKKAAFP